MGLFMVILAAVVLLIMFVFIKLYIKKEDCLRISEINRKLDSFINSFDKL